MSLRVTPQTQRNQTLHRVQETNRKLSELTAEVGSGRRLRVASDHPTDLGVVLSNRVELSRLDVNLQNIRSASSTVEFGVQMLREANGILDKVATTIADAKSGSGTSDQTTITRIDQLLQRFLEIANTKQAGRHLFSGSASTTPYELVAPDGESATQRVVYRGNTDESAVRIGAGLDVATHIPGSQIFGPRIRTTGETRSFGGTGIQTGNDTDSGVGRSELFVRHTTTHFADGSGIAAGLSSPAGDTILGPLGTHELAIVDTSGTGTAGTISLNGGPEVTFTSSDTDLKIADASGAIVYVDTTTISAGFNGAIAVGGDGELVLDGSETPTTIDFSDSQAVMDGTTNRLVHVDTSTVTRVGTEIIDFAASDDIFGTLLAARNDMENAADLDTATRVSLLDRRLENVEDIRENLLQMIGQMSGQAENLSAYEQHTEDMQIQIQSLTSDLEDADAVTAIVQLQAHEHQYNLELALAARISNMSLLNFLR